jgi:hypothetical protein
MSRRLRPLVALALVALISLISAGCGSNAPSETGTASSSGTSGSTGTAGSAGTGGTKKPTDQDKAVKFAECVRNNGVSDFPDPANGEPLVNTNRIPSAPRSCRLPMA